MTFGDDARASRRAAVGGYLPVVVAAAVLLGPRVVGYRAMRRAGRSR